MSATVYLVSPTLVRKTNDLLAKVRRARGTQALMQDWVTSMDASSALIGPPAPDSAEPVKPEDLPGSEAPSVVDDDPL